MANEITETYRLSVTNGNYESGDVTITNYQSDQASVGEAGGVQAIGTSEETLSSGDLTNKGLLWIKNLDTTNYVELGFATGVYPILLEANGGWARFKTSTSATVYLKADTAACNVQYKWHEA